MSTGDLLYNFTFGPGVEFDPVYKAFISSFYASVDEYGANTKCADHFTDDATFILGTSRATGRHEILTLLENTWNGVKGRKHVPGKAFPYGDGSGSIMTYGTCSYNLESGDTASVEFAGHMDIIKDSNGALKLKFYQAYITPI